MKREVSDSVPGSDTGSSSSDVFKSGRDSKSKSVPQSLTSSSAGKVSMSLAGSTGPSTINKHTCNFNVK